MTESTSHRVARIVRETLALAADEPVTDDLLLFYDLEFTSMDLLDMLFRLEEAFSIKIPEGTLYQLARGDTPESDFCRDSHLTPQGRLQLMQLLRDTPAQVFPEKIHAQTLPKYCTVGAFVRLVDHKLAEACSS